MTINIKNNPAFKAAAPTSAAVKTAASNAMSLLQSTNELSSKKLSSFLQAVNKHVSSPEQRLIMGVTALFSQPFIDLNNKRVNEETRLMSFARTMSKIFVGTMVGVIVRKEAIRFANNYTKLIKTKNKNNMGYWAQPDKTHSFFSPPYVRTWYDDYNKNYINAVGSWLGVGVSVFTNFLIDAPLTQIMTNYCYKKLKENSDDDKNLMHYNLLQEAINANKKKTVSFGAIDAAHTLDATKKIVGKCELGEGLDIKFHGWAGFKHWLWKKVVVNPSDVLMHSAAVGWGASSAAQIAGIAFNDKIDSHKKKFLIPQEFADAAGNIALYYLLTWSVKTGVEKQFERGKIRIKSVMDEIRKESALRGVSLENLFNNPELKVADALKNCAVSKELYLAHKNGASIFATLIASVISCNVLTPYFRNIYGAYWQDKLKERSAKINAKVFNINMQAEKLKPKTEQSTGFDKFIV